MSCYQKTYYWLMPSFPSFEILNKRRIMYANYRENHLAAHKVLARLGNREGAKLFKELANDSRKRYKACCIVLGHWFEDYAPGDCKYIDSKDWPPELIYDICCEYDAACM